jgi:hypothetical protein
MNRLFYTFLFFLALGLFTPKTWAHLGSAGIIHEGKAGPYQVQVIVEPPDVIPGTAKVIVLVDGTDIQIVEAKPIFFFSGDEGSPRSDALAAIPQEKGRFEGFIWLMSNGSASVQVTLKGGRGTGQVLIPIMAVSTAQRTMPSSTGWLLALLALLLVGLLTTIIGAASSDSLLKPGALEEAQVKKRRVIGSSLGAVGCLVLLYVGNNWWKSWADDYKANNLYQPFVANTKVVVENGQPVLSIAIDTNSLKGRSMSYVIPDHGKLMHLFLVRQGSMDAFAHLHPARLDTLHFRSVLPPLPAGKYLVYADLMRHHGLQYTLTDTVEVPPTQAKPTQLSGDADDTFVVTNPLNTSTVSDSKGSITICGKVGVKTKLQDGSTIVWEGKPNESLQVGKPYNLAFSVLTPEGKEAQLQTYLGMMGHAAVLKDDGSVYIHLHPNGTFSTTSVRVMQKRIDDTLSRPFILPPRRFKDSVDAVIQRTDKLPEAEREQFWMGTMQHGPDDGHHAGQVTFPYVFPQAGNYRIWLQIKRNGKILTGAFDVQVI